MSQRVKVSDHFLDIIRGERHGLADVGGGGLQALQVFGAGPAQWHEQAHGLAVAGDGDGDGDR